VMNPLLPELPQELRHKHLTIDARKRVSEWGQRGEVGTSYELLFLS
jgi:hypothetical protein